MKTIAYSNDDITLLWIPSICQDRNVCVNGMPDVYDPKDRPWVLMQNSTTEEIIDQVAACPSGALCIKEIAPIMFSHENHEHKGEISMIIGEEKIGSLVFVWSGTEICIISKVEVNRHFADKSYAKSLVYVTVNYARENGLLILPLCPIARSIFESDHSIHDVIYIPNIDREP